MINERANSNSGIINLNEILNMIWDRAGADQDASYFDFVKVHDQIIMSKIKKYSMDIRKMDFSGFDVQGMEDAIESVSTDLYDNITSANLDYMRCGMKIGARLVMELVI